MSSLKKMLARMAKNPKGWTASDVDRAYRAHGFDRVEGGKHTKYKHPKMPGQFATVTRSSGEIDAAYVVRLLELLDGII